MINGIGCGGVGGGSGAEWIAEEKDPDYTEFHGKVIFDRSKFSEEDNKNKTVERIKAILKEKFHNEIQAKEHEIAVINERIGETKVMLDRLRAYVVASYYGSGETLIPTTKAVPPKRRKPAASFNPDNKDRLNGGTDADNYLIDKALCAKFPEYNIPKSFLADDVAPAKAEKKPSHIAEAKVVNRFYVTHKVIVGNVSKYLGNDPRKENDKSTHKWMVYVRGGPEIKGGSAPDISSYVKSVWFFLHPSYIPNDIVRVEKPPFQITRRGWGEFPVRVQLHFKDARSKRFDIIHHLKLDKTYTGLQTLGAETIVNLELHRHTKNGFTIIDPLTPTPQPKIEEDYEPLTKPITDLIGETLLLDTNISSKHVSPLGSSSIKGETDDLSFKSINPNCVKNELFSARHSPVSSTRGNNNSPCANRNPCSGSQRLLKPLSINTTVSCPPSLASSCVTSANSSRCSSPVRQHRITFPKNSKVFSPEVDSVLRRLVISARLICPNESLRFQTFMSKSLEEYTQWSFSKRRASEWQRAAFMRKLFRKHAEKNKTNIPAPTTKQIMMWCRKNAFTPPERKTEVVGVSSTLTFCFLCGVVWEPLTDKTKPAWTLWCSNCLSNVTIARDTFNTRTNYKPMFSSARLKEQTLHSLDNLKPRHTAADENDEVDVVGIADKTPQPVMVEIIPSKELHWIYNTVNAIDIHLPTLTINSVKGPFLQAMLATATKCFLSELLTKSYVNTGELNSTTLEPSMITYSHVFKTIGETVKFDFLTDACMGKVEDEPVLPT